MSESLPSAIQTSTHGYYRRHDSHESFGFEAKSQSSEDIAPNLPLPDENDLYEYRGYAEQPPFPNAPDPPQDVGVPPDASVDNLENRNEVFLSDLAVDDGANDIDVDYDEPNTTVESRVQDTSFLLEKVVEHAPSSQERIYSSIPPSCRPSEFIEHTGFLNEPIQRFIQILLWNIKGRILQKEQKASAQPQLYSVIRAMESLYDKLERHIFVPSYSSPHHNLTRTKPQLRRQCNVYHENLFAKLKEKESEYVAENNAMFAMETKIASQVDLHRSPGNGALVYPIVHQATNDSDRGYKNGLYLELLNDAINECGNVLLRLLQTINDTDAYAADTIESLETCFSQQP